MGAAGRVGAGVARGRNRRKVEADPAVARARARRAFARALPVLGALAVLAIVGLLGWVGWTQGVEGDLLRIRELRFEGLSRVPVAELRELAPVRGGDHLLLSDLDAPLHPGPAQRHPGAGPGDE